MDSAQHAVMSESTAWTTICRKKKKAHWAAAECKHESTPDRRHRSDGESKTEEEGERKKENNKNKDTLKTTQVKNLACLNKKKKTPQMKPLSWNTSSKKTN